MKKLLLSISIVLITFSSFGQNKEGKLDDIGRIAITAYVPSTKDMGSDVTRVLETKLRSAVTRQGLSGVSLDRRFVITAVVNEMSKDITATAPPLIAYNLDVEVFIADAMTQSIFGQETFSVKGVGQNERKAYTAGLKQFNPTHPDLLGMIDKAKTTIIEFYNSQCDFILKEGQSLANVGKFEEAIAKFMTVPEVCKECYSKALDATEPVYLQMINKDCESSLQQAKNTWNAEQSYESAVEAIKFLSVVDPMSECFQDVQQYSLELNENVKVLRDRDKDVEDREWNFVVQVHNDEIALVKYQTDAEMEQAMAEIDAAKEVGMAKIKSDTEIAQSNNELAKSNNQLSGELAKARIDAYREVGLAQAKALESGGNDKDKVKGDKIDVSFIPGLEETGGQ